MVQGPVMKWPIIVEQIYVIYISYNNEKSLSCSKVSGWVAIPSWPWLGIVHGKFWCFCVASWLHKPSPLNPNLAQKNVAISPTTWELLKMSMGYILCFVPPHSFQIVFFWVSQFGKSIFQLLHAERWRDWHLFYRQLVFLDLDVKSGNLRGV